MPQLKIGTGPDTPHPMGSLGLPEGPAVADVVRSELCGLAVEGVLPDFRYVDRDERGTWIYVSRTPIDGDLQAYWKLARELIGLLPESDRLPVVADLMLHLLPENACPQDWQLALLHAVCPPGHALPPPVAGRLIGRLKACAARLFSDLRGEFHPAVEYLFELVRDHSPQKSAGPAAIERSLRELTAECLRSSFSWVGLRADDGREIELPVRRLEAVLSRVVPAGVARSILNHPDVASLCFQMLVGAAPSISGGAFVNELTSTAAASSWPSSATSRAIFDHIRNHARQLYDAGPNHPDDEQGGDLLTGLHSLRTLVPGAWPDKRGKTRALITRGVERGLVQAASRWSRQGAWWDDLPPPEAAQRFLTLRKGLDLLRSLYRDPSASEDLRNAWVKISEATHQWAWRDPLTLASLVMGAVELNDQELGRKVIGRWVVGFPDSGEDVANPSLLWRESRSETCALVAALDELCGSAQSEAIRAKQGVDPGETAGDPSAVLSTFLAEQLRVNLDLLEQLRTGSAQSVRQFLTARLDQLRGWPASEIFTEDEQKDLAALVGQVNRGLLASEDNGVIAHTVELLADSWTNSLPISVGGPVSLLLRSALVQRVTVFRDGDEIVGTPPPDSARLGVDRAVAGVRGAARWGVDSQSGVTQKTFRSEAKRWIAANDPVELPQTVAQLMKWARGFERRESDRSESQYALLTTLAIERALLERLDKARLDKDRKPVECALAHVAFDSGDLWMKKLAGRVQNGSTDHRAPLPAVFGHPADQVAERWIRWTRRYDAILAEDSTLQRHTAGKGYVAAFAAAALEPSQEREVRSVLVKWMDQVWKGLEDVVRKATEPFDAQRTGEALRFAGTFASDMLAAARLAIALNRTDAGEIVARLAQFGVLDIEAAYTAPASSRTPEIESALTLLAERRADLEGLVHRPKETTANS